MYFFIRLTLILHFWIFINCSSIILFFIFVLITVLLYKWRVSWLFLDLVIGIFLWVLTYFWRIIQLILFIIISKWIIIAIIWAIFTCSLLIGRIYWLWCFCSWRWRVLKIWCIPFVYFSIYFQIITSNFPLFSRKRRRKWVSSTSIIYFSISLLF